MAAATDATVSPPVSKENVIAAIETMYSSHCDAGAREGADRWLRDFQHQIIAWQCCDQLLRDAAVSPNVHFFAANTLKSKIRSDFEDIPADQRENLKNSLLNLIVAHRGSKQNVLTQLSLAVAEIALQLQWSDSVKDIVSNFGTTIDLMPCVLQVLLVLAEEVQTQSSEAHLSAFAQNIRSQSDGVMMFLHHWFGQIQSASSQEKSSSSHHVHTSFSLILRCFARWLPFVNLPAEAILQSPLIHYARGVGIDPESETFDDSIEILLCLVRKSKGCPAEAQPIVVFIMSNFGRFRERYQLAFANEDISECRGLAQLFSEIGESYKSALLSCQKESAEVVEMLLVCTAHPDESVNAITFYFWYKFCKLLLLKENKAGRDFYSPAFCQLIDILSTASKYPEEAESWGKEKEEEFRQFRHQVADTIVDACAIAGGEVLLSRVVPALQTCAQAYAVGRAGWSDIEARLYCIRSVGRLVSEGNGTMAAVFELLPLLAQHWRLKYTMTLLIGRYAHWINRHAHLLPALFSYVTQGLSKQELCGASAMCIHFLCVSCAEHMVPILDHLFAIYDLLGSLLPQDEQEIIRGLGAVLPKVPPEHLQGALNRLFAPLLKTLNESIQSQSMASVSATLIRMTTLFQTISASSDLAKKAQAPLGEIANGLWPTLQSVLLNLSQDAGVAEQLCRSIKQMVRCCVLTIRPIVPTLVENLTTMFTKTHYSAMLYALNTCIAEFGHEGNMQAVLFKAVLHVSQAVFALLNSLDQCTNHPDVVEEYFEIAGRCLRRFPETLLFSLGDSLMQFGLQALSLQHPSACESVIAFFENIVACEPPRVSSEVTTPSPDHRSLVDRLLAAYGEKLVGKLIVGVNGAMPSRVHQQTADVFVLLVKNPMFVSWVQTALASIPADKLPSMEDRNEFGRQICMTSEINIAKRIVDDFSFRSRPHRRFH